MEIIKKNRATPFLSVYLILRKNDDVLLLLRKNTGYCDGQYGFVSGHVDEGESANTAIIREAYEEAGITILPEHLHLAHTRHRLDGRENFDLFFECTSWEGTPLNCEPEKCVELTYFPLNNLPVNTIGYIQEVLKAIPQNQFYSESGWPQS